MSHRRLVVALAQLDVGERRKEKGHVARVHEVNIQDFTVCNDREDS